MDSCERFCSRSCAQASDIIVFKWYPHNSVLSTYLYNGSLQGRELKGTKGVPPSKPWALSALTDYKYSHLLLSQDSPWFFTQPNKDTCELLTRKFSSLPRALNTLGRGTTSKVLVVGWGVKFERHCLPFCGFSVS